MLLLFWYKVFVHWKLNLFNFLVDSALILNVFVVSQVFYNHCNLNLEF